MSSTRKSPDFKAKDSLIQEKSQKSSDKNHI